MGETQTDSRLVYQPAALFPSWYLEPWVSQPPADSEKSPEELADSDNHPGETIAIDTIVAERAVERSEVYAAPGRVDLPIPPITISEAIAILREAGWPQEWLEEITAIGACESSGGKRDENGPLFHPGETGDGGNSLGWLQLWYGWFPAAGEDVERWWDPVVNARTALYVREVRGRFGGAGGWTCADLSGIY